MSNKQTSFQSEYIQGKKMKMKDRYWKISTHNKDRASNKMYT